MPAPQEIVELVDQFSRRINEYRSSLYNETELRNEFVNPFFAALGWDMKNRQGLAGDLKEVKVEESIRVEESVKNPDYSFRLGRSRKFFVETKKPSINIEAGIYPAFQLRRYAWSARLSLSILTDFEEFAVYDCRAEPNKTDKPGKGRLVYLQYDQYVERWDEIAALFSKEAVLAGSLERFIEAIPEKRGNKRVDAALLDEISGWREALAASLARRNPDLSQSDLNFAVQRTIDRLLFLRICEDRAIEEYGRLKALLQEDGVYARLMEIFREADQRYNSGIFHFQEERDRAELPDSLTGALVFDDATLKDIIRDLYYPDSPYVFSEIPAEILGQVYEQFLGKVIRLEEEHRAVVEDKPEVRKAGGVYYTPSYIVEYIVKNTVGRLLEGKSASEAAEIRILDPACGSGSFLIGAYQHLLDWHLEWYKANLAPMLDKSGGLASEHVLRLLPAAPEKRADRRGKKIQARAAQAALPITKDSIDREWRLTTSERKRILKNSIYGLDIDSQAVEVTKLPLLLKVLEGESRESISSLLRYFKERALPDLGDNIKCGNSLIGYDYYDDHPNMSDKEVRKINAFDWKRGFPEVFQRGGFDAVIGNPPYVRQEGLGELKDYLSRHYRVYHGVADLYAYFIEKGVSLLRPAGLFSYIVANKWMRANYGGPLRRWLKEQHIEEIVDFGDLPVFTKATTYPCILRISKEDPEESFFACQVKTLRFSSLEEYVREHSYAVRQQELDESGWSLADERTQRLLAKLKAIGVPLGEYVGGKIYYGIKTGLNEAFVIDEATRARLIAEDARSAELIKPFLAGRDIKRYEQPRNDKFLIFTRHGLNIGDYPAVKQYLTKFKERLTPKPKNWIGRDWKGRKPGAYEWYEIQDTIDYHKEFDKPKIIIPAIVRTASYAYDTFGVYSNDKTSIIPTEDLYLLGVMNSKIADTIIHSVSSTKQSGYFEYKPMYVSQIPIRTIDFSDPADVSRHDRIVELVQTMLDLHRQLSTSGQEHERTLISRRIEATDRQIDRLVYELYGLTEEEIELVETAK